MRLRLRNILLFSLLLFVLIPAISGYAAGAGEGAGPNLLQNSDFEQADPADAGAPLNWTKDVWVQGDDATRFGLETGDTHAGGSAIVIENLQPNHAKWVQKLAVEPDSYYHVTGWVKVSGTDAAMMGANLFVMDVGFEFPQLKDTAGEWKQLEFYGKTGPKQKELRVAASLGGYNSLNVGKALFDDLSMNKVESLPEGVQAFSLVPADTSNNKDDKEAKPPQVSALYVLSLSALFAILFAFLYQRMIRERSPLESRSKRGSGAPIIGWLIIALGFRVCVSAAIPGYINDMNTFIYWGNAVVEKGISNFYNGEMFADYPPGYIYVLHVLALIQQLFGLDSTSRAAFMLYKLPAIAADLAAAWLIFQTARKKLTVTASFGLAMLYVWNPAVWLDSAAWGQVDSIFTFLLILSILRILDDKIEIGALWFAIAVLVKPQALIFMPVVLLAVWHKRDWTRAAVGALYGIALFFALALPFFWSNGGIGGLINLYKTTLASYPYATLNAFNLYTLTGGNWAGIDEAWLLIPYRAWGAMAIGLAVVLALVYSLAGKDKSNLSKSFYIASVLITVMFLFGTKMHERYMFPAILLFVFAYIFSQDRRLLRVLLGYSITFLINVGYVLQFSEQTVRVPTDGIVIVTAIVNLVLFVYLLYIGYDLYIRGRVQLVPPIPADEQSRSDKLLLDEVREDGTAADVQSVKLGLTKKDWLAMSAITLIYAVVALFNLGSTHTLSSGWTPGKVGQSFYVDFGEEVQLERMNSFGGTREGKYKLEFGVAPDGWNKPVEYEQKGGDSLKWVIHKLDERARYVKITALTREFSIQEIAFYAQGSESPIVISEVVELDAAPAAADDTADKKNLRAPARLFDEQSSAAYTENYMNSSYFDEIYHGRTALENIEGVRAYENTHPPLGKLIIALGIKIFGLSPFGWRIMGTLFGIAMVPIMYLFALRLFRKTGYAAAATALLAAEFMHFTQTRIATIDVYGVFFIMLMFYFMHKYVLMNFYNTPLRKTLVPLCTAGVLFGIGVASKWIVIYGGAGLAVMLFWSLFERYRQYAAAKRAIAAGSGQEDDENFRRIVKLFPRNTIITLAVCVIFYVAVPAVVYGLSYIPVLNVQGDEYTAQRLVDYQKNMYHYHSELVATHPYSSQWWEWPFMKRPVWYYSGDDVANPDYISTISAFGNPLIWWTGLFALLGALYFSWKLRDKRVYVIWIAYFSQYLPWMLVPRLTFLYHYFAMVPFMIMAIIYMFKLYEEKHPDRQWVRWLYVAGAAVLFFMYYPVLSGFETARWYAAVLSLFDSWVFFS
ncbi:phospholipid carrier-dependent glycosyltransferase [Paenibacillus sp. NEAU-GSW1]|uniref:phospholipid carrier-dependent glycosyltransferase n=1 Tax=Paenibacillus sp. NEAU-GSW1 TaxID=2682486 RepID=UPI0012E2B52C|nr:phospholipid carrier-dependent glycosyltransferase [Paenibacillus sp. NEAU-GSW1]MUT67657.1 phospholipid carrier-dependent glycosyltransferase [Paenibacillus sp. NEAU-GSW1]